MPQQNTYKKTLPDVLLDLFKANMGDVFRSYRIGDPIIIGESLMPSLIITEPRTGYSQSATGFDDIEHEVLIQIIFNKKDEFGKPDDRATLDQTIDEVMQGRDETTGDFVDNSILGVLRRNLTLSNYAVNSIGTVEKGYVNRSDTLTTAEAHVRVTVTEWQSIANRV